MICENPIVRIIWYWDLVATEVLSYYYSYLLARFFNIFNILFSLILNTRIIASVSLISCDIIL